MGVIKITIMLIWSIICITLSLVFMVVTFNRKNALKMARWMWAPGILKVLGVKPVLTGVENYDSSKTYVIMSNHLSSLDIPTLFKSLKLNIHFIAKKELKKVPFLGWYMSATGMIFIDRNDTSSAKLSLEKAGQLVKNGKTVLIFPEGTVSLNDKMLPFKKGGFHLALASGVEILPIAISGTNVVWPDGTNTKFGKSQVKVKIGRPISTQNVADVNQLTVKVKNAIQELKGS